MGLFGRLDGLANGQLLFSPRDPHENLDRADGKRAKNPKHEVDAWIDKNGIDAPNDGIRATLDPSNRSPTATRS